MKQVRFRPIVAILACTLTTFCLAGCALDQTQVSFLDIVDTILLGITAAGGLAILRNV